jgi:hypothetical protein
MSTVFRSLVAVLLFACSTLLIAQDKDKEQADNPFYKFWSTSGVGSTVTLKESTKLSGPAAGETGTDVKMIEYTLLERTPEQAVVKAVVTEGDTFGFVQSAPTKHIYPAKMSKEVLDDILKETGAKSQAETIKIGDKELKVRHLTGMMKRGEDEAEFHIWLSEEVPGQIVKRTRTTKSKGGGVAETTVELVKFDKK